MNRPAETRGSKRNYPLNCWWVAGAAEEVTRKPLCRWLLERRVVLFRTEQGAVVALADRCAHRWAPLSQGKVLGDEIECPYHGFRYDTHGVCTLVPTQAHVPAALKVRSYPVREHGTFVWIWMGDPARADPALLPDIPCFTDHGFLQLRGYHGEIGCNYMLVQENVLDLTHLPHLHADTLRPEGWQQPAADVRVTDRSVTFVLTHPEVAVDAFFATAMGVEATKRVNRRTWGSFASPACHFSGVDFEDPTPANGQRARYNFRALNCMTPISPDRFHHWWALAQDYGYEVPDLAELLVAGQAAVYKQDRDLLEAIQRTVERDMRGGNSPEVLVAADRAAVEARRVLQRMLEADSP